MSNFVEQVIQENFVNGLKEEAAQKAQAKRDARQREREAAIIEANRQKENLIRQKDEGSDIDSDDDLLCDPELEDIRRKRMAKLKAKVTKKQVAKLKGHGDYKVIQETEFLKEVTTTKKVICHFFHKDFERCKIMDKHLSLLCKKHSDFVKIVKIDAEKAPFFVNKLVVRILPTIIFFTDGISEPHQRLMGFDGLPNGDEFCTRDLEEILLGFEMIKECKFEEENVEEFVHAAKGNRIQGGGNVYGFNRNGGDYDSSDEDV
eukprot:g9159.t1